MWISGLFLLCAFSVLHGAAAVGCKMSNVPHWSEDRTYRVSIVDGQVNTTGVPENFFVQFCKPIAWYAGCPSAFVGGIPSGSGRCDIATTVGPNVSDDGYYYNITTVMPGTPEKTAKVVIVCDESVTDGAASIMPKHGSDSIVKHFVTTDGAGNIVKELYELSFRHSAACGKAHPPVNKCTVDDVPTWSSLGWQNSIVDGRTGPSSTYLYQIAFCSPTYSHGGAQDDCSAITSQPTFMKQWNEAGTQCFSAVSQNFDFTRDGYFVNITSMTPGTPQKMVNVIVTCDENVTGPVESTMPIDPRTNLPVIQMWALTDGLGNHVKELYEFSFKHAKACGPSGARGKAREQ